MVTVSQTRTMIYKKQPLMLSIYIYKHNNNSKNSILTKVIKNNNKNDKECFCMLHLLTEWGSNVGQGTSFPFLERDHSLRSLGR